MSILHHFRDIIDYVAISIIFAKKLFGKI